MKTSVNAMKTTVKESDLDKANELMEFDSSQQIHLFHQQINIQMNLQIYLLNHQLILHMILQLIQLMTLKMILQLIQIQ